MRRAEATGALRAGRLTEETFEWLEVDKELEVLSVNGAYRVAGHERISTCLLIPLLHLTYIKYTV